MRPDTHYKFTVIFSIASLIAMAIGDPISGVILMLGALFTYVIGLIKQLEEKQEQTLASIITLTNVLRDINNENTKT